MRWSIAGAIVYFGLAFMLVLTVGGNEPFPQAAANLVGLGEFANPTILVLIIAGILLFFVTLWTIGKDKQTMRREEDDIDWVHSKQRAGLQLVFADPRHREQLFRRGALEVAEESIRIETLIDDRVRRVMSSAKSGSGAVSVEELRIVAEKRTSRYGSFARYASSLMLLLAVLGTFAGIKSALPKLIDAIGTPSGSASAQGASSTSSGTLTQLREPLRAVSGAFGGNALALIGAIAIGLMANGIAVGRRNLLERLELVSTEFIYGDETAAGSNPLQAAVLVLKSTALDLQSASGSLSGVEGQLLALGRSFERSIENLTSSISDAVKSQEDSLYDRTSASMDALETRTAELALAIRGNADVYRGLVESVGQRADETTAAIEQIRNTNHQLTTGIESFLRVSQSAVEMFARAESAYGKTEETFVAFQVSAKQIASATAQTVGPTEAFSRTVGQLEQRLTQIGTASEEMLRYVQQADQNSAARWTNTAEELTAKMSRSIELASTANSKPMAAVGQNQLRLEETLAVLRQIEASVGKQRPDSLAQKMMLASTPAIIAASLVGAAVFWALRT